MTRRALATAWVMSVALAVLARGPALAARATEERPVLQAQADLPIAYLLSRGAMEATLSIATANQTFDPFGATGTSLVGARAPGPGNAGFPNGVAGRNVRATLGTGKRFNVLADVGRDDYNFSIRGLTLDHQIYGFRWNLIPEHGNIPAITFEYDYHLREGPGPLESDGHRMVFVGSKGFGQHILAHAVLGAHRDEVTAELPFGPAPQLALPIPTFFYPQSVLELGLGVTWVTGRRSDLSLHLDHRNFDRKIDDLIPGGGRVNNDRVLLNFAHGFTESLVIGLRLERHSSMLLALHPQLYNVRSAGAFTEPFGWMGFTLTWRGDLGRP